MERANLEMEQSQRNLHDCYFYYYSTCRKGKSCVFRHEPAALGHDQACKLFLEGKCFNRGCTLRHMKIQKPRSGTQCYWESQPGGCRKPHCVFQHRNPRPGTAGALPTAAGPVICQPGAPGGLILLPRIL